MSLKKLGRYDLIRVLGKGAMGLVYEGRDPNLDRRVAIKTIKVENLSEEAAAEYEVRFRTEARSAARLQHPNIVSVYDSDRDGDIAFLVMEFVQGDDLKHHLDKGDLYTLEQTLGIMDDLLSALSYAHSQSIVHRDIKPANLLMQPGGRVKLTDFGVARIQDSGEATRTQGSMVGTLKYMSPEQVQGRPIDARADLFAAGIVLYQLLTGKRPFDADSDFAIIQQIMTHNPASPSSFNAQLPVKLDAVMARALAKSRDERYASAQEFSMALRAAIRDAADATVVPPAGGAKRGASSTWTATLRAGEALVGTQAGMGTNSGTSAVTQELELVYWKDIKESNDVQDIQVFLDKFPSGIYADLARRRLRKLGVSVGEASDTGSRSGIDTLILQREAAQMEATRLMPRNSAIANAASKAHGEMEVAGQPVSDPISQANPEASAGDPEMTRLGKLWPVENSEELFTQTHQHATSRIAVAESGDDLSSPPAVPVPAAAKTASNKHWLWIGAGIVLLGGAWAGAKLMSGPPEAVEEIIETGAVVTVPPSAAPAASSASMVLPASPPTTAASGAASRASATAIASASRASAASGKDKPAATTTVPSATAAPAPAAPPVRATAAAPSPAATERAAAAQRAPESPRDACEGRILLGFQICMTEQCAKPAYAQHPICVERRAMDQRRKEAEQQRD